MTTSDDQVTQDTIVLAAEPCARSRLQCSDIILRACPTPKVGWRWTDSVLADYPGCLIAVAHALDGRWCLQNIRGLGGLFVQARAMSLDEAMVSTLARLSYRDLVSARTDRLQADIEAHGSLAASWTGSPDDLPERWVDQED